MTKTFLCYLHKPDSLAPELRVIACESGAELPDAIVAELPTWGEWEMIDVYDTDLDEPLIRVTPSGPAPTH